MSVNGSMSGIRFAGLGSGIDTDSIVNQLMSLERIPLQRLQVREIEVQNRRTLYGEMRSRARNLQSAIQSLNQQSVFNPVRATSSDDKVATVTAQSGASNASVQLSVSRLAQGHRVTSSAQASASNALGTSGSFLLNGKRIDVAAGDSLTAIAGKINAANTGVTASVINGGPGQAYLSLGATNTGAASRMSLASVSGNALNQLGLLNGTRAIRDGSNSEARSSAASTTGTTLASAFGVSGSGELSLGGEVIRYEETDSLSTLADKINAANGSVTARVETTTNNGTSQSRLVLTGGNILTDFEDPSGFFEQIGVVQRGFANEVTAAQDAQFSIDGVSLSSSTNTIADVVPGVTITLKSADALAPKTTTIGVTRDDEKVLESVRGIVSAFNGLVDYVRSNSEFDKESFRSGPLFGDATARQLVDSTADMLFGRRATSGSELIDLTQVGFGRDTDGKIKLDESRFRAAMERDAGAVSRLFMDTGTTSDSNLTYITAGSRTSGLTNAAVTITQAATASTATGRAGSGTLSGPELLTFGGAIFGGRTVNFAVAAGQTRQQLADAINSDSRLRDLVQARILNDGSLQIQSKSMGSRATFTVTSNLSATDTNSGIGDSTIVQAGLDVAGTINGEAATGDGTLLTGNSGNATTAGLQIRYSGTTTGSVGTINFTKGFSSLMVGRLETFTDTTQGLFKAQDDGFQSSLDDINRTRSSLEAQLAVKERTIRERFLAMETAINRLRAQQQQMSSFGAG